ncbi:MAG: histidinol-phosphate aminotransferase [Planctomycetota bacterium]
MINSSAYQTPERPSGAQLDLSRNEGRAPGGLVQPPLTAGQLAQYPDLGQLTETLATRFGLAPDRVLITAGGDDALMRTCLATLTPGANGLLTKPTFEMISRYIALAGGSLREVTWNSGSFPLEDFLAGIDAQTRVAFVVSPNNPTGGVASAQDLIDISKALPAGLVVLDAAYAEFTQADLTATALELGNVVVVRTFSKAWGLAGLRTGYVLGPANWIERLRASGNPYPVAAVSAELARLRLQSGEADMRDYVTQVRSERAGLAQLARDLGLCPAEPHEGNFVLLQGLDSEWMRSAMGSLGVATRSFPGRPELAGALRISLPGEPQGFAQLTQSLRIALAPSAMLFDMDGVLADVSGSYRAAILSTAQDFGVTLTSAEIDHAKQRGAANDDWVLTQTLLHQHGVEVALEEVIDRFQGHYLGGPGKSGLRERESLLVDRKLLADWSRSYRLGIVTGRPRAEALDFLERFDLLELFDAVVCREDAELKPSPAPVRLALERLGCSRAWMLGDTRDDLVAARGAGVLPIGVLDPSAANSAAGSERERRIGLLLRAGAARVLLRAADLQELLP